uniref:RNA ligase 1 n=1 Tax=Capra hircus TaxID=9925 RepID=A0A452EAB9_CAPHI
MRRLGSVQRKMPCVFVTEVKEEPSTKREHQPFKVLATETVSHKALDADIYNAIPTEKVDGTCCYVTNYKGQPYLWARLDRKPNKLAEKRFKNFLHSKQNSKEFFWNVEEDFKPVPECWIPAKEIEQLNGNPMPDENGHIPGWVPVEKNNKQYCWHSSVVNYEFEIALVLRHHPDDPGLLEISAVPLSDLLEQTLELIGTNINGNPYGLGSKKHPLHLLIPHGAFQIRNLPTLKHSDLLSWFDGCREGKIEGIVWHCNDGCLIKMCFRIKVMKMSRRPYILHIPSWKFMLNVHRHHLGLCWPIPDTYMNSKPVIINMNLNKYEYAFDAKCLFNHFSKIDNQKFGRLKDIILNV